MCYIEFFHNRNILVVAVWIILRLIHFFAISFGISSVASYFFVISCRIGVEWRRECCAWVIYIYNPLNATRLVDFNYLNLAVLSEDIHRTQTDDSSVLVKCHNTLYMNMTPGHRYIVIIIHSIWTWCRVIDNLSSEKYIGILCWRFPPYSGVSNMLINTIVDDY